jgi:hypothetical protein
VDWRDLPPIAPIAKPPQAGVLDITGAGFIDFPCGLLVGRDQVEAKSKLRVGLAPGERRVLGVLIDVDSEPDPTRLDAAIFHVREQRSDGVQGGVTIIAASAPDLIADVTDAEDRSACPVELSSRPIWTDVAEGGRRHRSVPNYSAGFLVAEVRNNSKDPIEDLELWLESHTIPEARIEPLVFQSVLLEAGATLRCVWPIDVAAPPTGAYLASLVASSPRHAPHRLLVDVLIGRSRDIPRVDEPYR